MNLDKAVITFINESNELLEDAEQQLLAIDGASSQQQLHYIHALFRAVHTIKGSAGLFGFEVIVEVAHSGESLLDEIRNRELVLDKPLVDLFLKLKDHLVGLVANCGDESNKLSDLDKQMIAELDTKCVELTNGACEHQTQWWISFYPNPSVFQDGLDPSSFIHYLAQQYQVTDMTCVPSPSMMEQGFNPEICYLGFEILLNADATAEEVRAAFEFIIHESQLSILPFNSPSVAVDANEISLAPDWLALREQALQTMGIAVQSDSQDQQASPESINDINQSLALQSSRTLRVNADKLDNLIDQVGEMVISGARTGLLARSLGNEELNESISQLERLVENVRDSSLKLRMIPIGETFNKYKRVVRDLAAELGKEVNLSIQGADTELDKTFIERINDPLLHILRNAVDHGLESAEQRQVLGKSQAGQITLASYHDAGSIVVEVRDDGAGLDLELIKAKAVAQGLIANHEELAERELLTLIFAPGFSTSSDVTNISGRGVGLDVVKQNIEQLRGAIEVDSKPSQGTCFRFRLPLTLSIIEGFMFEVGQSNYVVPLDTVVECMELCEVVAESEIANKDFLYLRGEVLPFIRLETLFGSLTHQAFEKLSLIVVQFGAVKAGLVVNTLKGEFQTVVKPLGKLFEGMRCISGATILGSGEVAFILDVSALIRVAINDYQLNHQVTSAG
ncbi:chemotaxis protein CheA [Vibrio sp. SCSIO 43136]|uniref:chemotaxis protein CheA n=1 Tax=Vibrio sp. SCSIO 43136 TaxID=2819101 RepID=UPI002074CF70|nr:chemotaxis protein CheA [Vibrio sp. SCSIO 43136]USD64254.1 chemotaxis protein CheA [Vibrio sp. SCSIO 43136]